MQTKEVHMKRYFFCVCNTIKHSRHCPSQWLSKLIYRFVFLASKSLTQHHRCIFFLCHFTIHVDTMSVSDAGVRKLLIFGCCLSVNCSGSVVVTQLASCERLAKWCDESKSLITTYFCNLKTAVWARTHLASLAFTLHPQPKSEPVWKKSSKQFTKPKLKCDFREQE